VTSSLPDTDASHSSTRRHDLDALRAFAMLLGIALHISLSFFPTFWSVQDSRSSSGGWYDEFFFSIHGFRMPLFFLLSGYFTAMLWQRRGLKQLLWHRITRIGFPLAGGDGDDRADHQLGICSGGVVSDNRLGGSVARHMGSGRRSATPGLSTLSSTRASTLRRATRTGQPRLVGGRILRPGRRGHEAGRCRCR